MKNTKREETREENQGEKSGKEKEDEKGKVRSKSPNKAHTFPLVSIMSQADMKAVLSVMEGNRALAEEIKAMTELQKEEVERIKPILAQYEEVAGMGGVRWGPIALYYTPGKTRRTLNTEMLIKAGVKVSVIEKCYKESKPWDEVKIVAVDEAEEG